MSARNESQTSRLARLRRELRALLEEYDKKPSPERREELEREIRTLATVIPVLESMARVMSAIQEALDSDDKGA